MWDLTSVTTLTWSDDGRRTPKAKSWNANNAALRIKVDPHIQHNIDTRTDNDWLRLARRAC